MDIKLPAIFLSFDDSWIDNWHKALPFFDTHDIKATFYLTFGVNNGKPGIPYVMTDNRWVKLGEIQNAGHTIGFHTVGHKRSDATMNNIGCLKYKAIEICPGVMMMKDHGVIPRHFAYPYGVRSKESDECLLGVFDTLRGTVHPRETELMRLYDIEDLSNQRVFTALDILYEPLPEWLDRLVEEEKIGFFHGHNCNHWIQGNLQRIFEFARNNNVNFYPMSILDRNQKEQRDASTN